jgi:hypothetical protein
MTKEYATMEIELDQDLEFQVVQTYVDTKFTPQSKSVFDDEVASGVDVRIAFYDAWRNEQIIEALKWALENEKHLKDIKHD